MNEVLALVETRIIYPGGDVEESHVSLPETSSPRRYPMLRDYVEPLVGGPMEHVRVWWAFYGKGSPAYLDMFVNENGRLVYLPRNERATAIYRNNVLRHQKPAPPAEALPWICGTAVLFSRKVWF